MGEATGEANLSQARFSLFLNPADKQITLRAENIEEGDDWTMQLLSSTGQQVISQKGFSASNGGEVALDLTPFNLVNGMYLVQLRNSKGQRHTLRFVKQQ